MVGSAEGGGGYYGNRWNCYDEDDEDMDDEDDVEMGEINDRTTTIKNLVDLGGVKISNSVEFDDEKECIPSDLIDTLEEGEWDDQDYEGYQGNVSCRLFNFFGALLT